MFNLTLQIVLLFLVVTSLVFYCACIFCTFNFLQERLFTYSNHNEPVSILIPVCGLDSGALINWASFCQQDYPAS